MTDCTCSCHTACGAGAECLPVQLAAAEASQTDEESETMGRALFARKNNDVFGECSAEEGQKHSFSSVLMGGTNTNEFLAEGGGNADTTHFFFPVAHGGVVVEAHRTPQRQLHQLRNFIRHGRR